MDIDDPTPPQNNALAGPSSLSAPPPVIFPPQPAPLPPPTYLRSTQDLLARFQLLSAYDKHVRAAISPVEHGQDHVPLHPPTPAIITAKGKEREKDPLSLVSPAAHEPGVDNADADDDDGAGHGEKKKKNNYRHLIKGVPGKHSMKRDTYLTTIMQIPPKERMTIVPFDSKTQAEAFTVSPEGLKNWNLGALVAESPQAREDRKKRKELKKLAKAQALPLQTPAPVQSSASSSTNHPPTHVSIPSALSTSARATTPKPGIPRPGPLSNHPTSQAPLATTGLGTPLSAVSLSPPITSTNLATAYLVSDKEKRGKKREHDGGLSENAVVTTVNPVTSSVVVGINGTIINGVPARPIFNSKAGIPGARPRPIKKQRMDIQGQARDVTIPVQQPTPQGV